METKKTRKRRTDVLLAKLTEAKIESIWESALSGDDREFWEAEFARTVPRPTQEKPVFGSFLADLAAGRLPRPAPLSAEEDERITKRALERAFLPKKVARLEAEVAAMKRANNPARKCILWTYVREAKRKNPLKVSDHAFISICVDALLERAGKELRQICPKSWKEVRDLPRLLSDARNHPKLKGPVKVFISKVPVS